MFKSRAGPRDGCEMVAGRVKSLFLSFNLYSDRVKQLPRSLLMAAYKILRPVVFVFPNRTLSRQLDRRPVYIGVRACIRICACVCMCDRVIVCRTRAMKIKSENGSGSGGIGGGG
jgi:hypothetical protein|uniref:Uncharacterized protein n=1 Tax=Sipha flava TaxID=143950 RepID=A0A2S2QYJ9_9HEMI